MMEEKYRLILAGAKQLTDIGNALLWGPVGTTKADIEYCHDRGWLEQKPNYGILANGEEFCYTIVDLGRKELENNDPHR